MIHKFFKITLMMIMLLCSLLSVEASSWSGKNFYSDNSDDKGLLYNGLELYRCENTDGYLLSLEGAGTDFWNKFLSGNYNDDDYCPISYDATNKVIKVKNSVLYADLTDKTPCSIAGLAPYCFDGAKLPDNLILDLTSAQYNNKTYIDKWAFKGCNFFASIKFNAKSVYFNEECFDYGEQGVLNKSLISLDFEQVDNFYYKDNNSNRYDAFSSLQNLKDITINGSVRYEMVKGTLLDKDDKHSVIAWLSPESEILEESKVTLPDDIDPNNTYNITEIGQSAFQNYKGCRQIVDVGSYNYVPIQLTINVDRITKVGSNAFRNAAISKLTFIRNSTSNILNVGSGAFSGEIDGNKSASTQNNNKLRYVWLPDFVNIASDKVFYNNPLLETVRVPEGIKSINSSMFANCTNLKNIIIPSSVTSIGENAFAGCTSLTSVVLPKNLENINASAFTGCTSLKEVYIPDESGSSNATDIKTALDKANKGYSVYTSLSGDNYKNLNPKNSMTVNLIPGSLQLLSYPLPVGLITGENKTLGNGTDLFAYIMTDISRPSGSEYATVDLAHLYGDGVSLKYIPANMPFFVWNHSTENKTVNVYFVPESTKDDNWESGAKGGSSTFAKAYKQLIATPLPTRIDRYSDNVVFTDVNVDGHYNASPSIDNYLPLNSAGKASDQNSADNGYTLMGFMSINKDGYQYQGKFMPFAYKSFSESSTSPSSAKAVLFMKTSDLFGNSGTSGIKGFKFNVIDESELWDNTTGIDDISDNTFKTKTDDAWYSLDGRRVVSPSKGLYIHNGKKIVIR